ncbi:MAG: TIGR03087 family PEP-CTERM/XrtA system glycosyltransferase [Bryobacteraceae bacterium]
MELLYLSHCVPNPPDKGEKIRAYHELTALASRHRVHLSCFARSEQEMEDARALLDRCASVYVAPLFPFFLHAARAGARFLAGASINDSFYWSGRLSRDLLGLLESRPVAGAVAYTAVMAPYVPSGTPFVLDMTDVDSEKWRAYARYRKPSVLFETEAKRLVRLEVREARRARLTLVTTAAEREALLKLDPGLRCEAMENGVDFARFDPQASPRDERLEKRRYLLFCGTLDYFPNEQGITEFARTVFPMLRGRDPALELLVVGRNPTPRVLALAGVPGVEMVGSVEDVRPYYRHALATVVPLRIARGIQNKVLESLAMDRPVLASPEVCATFGATLPRGVRLCRSPEDYAAPVEERGIRKEAMGRFSWKKNLAILERAVEELGRRA